MTVTDRHKSAIRRMHRNAASFNQAMRITGRKIPADAMDTVLRRTVLTAIDSLTKMTPVDTGRARGNWQTSAESPKEGTIGPRSAGEVMYEALGITGKPGEDYPTFWITNNLPYISALEAGHSSQAPQGMMALTLAKLEGMFT